MRYTSVTDRTVHVDVDAPEPLPSIARIIRTVEWPTQRTIKIAGLLFTVYKIYYGIGEDLVEVFQDLIELVLFFLEGYSVKLVKYASASMTAGAEGTASVTIIPPVEQSIK